MAYNKAAVYDNDYVTLGQVNELLNNTLDESDTSNITYAKHFGSQPQPPYHSGDTYMSTDGKTYTCNTTRLVGYYNSSDWELLVATDKIITTINNSTETSKIGTDKLSASVITTNNLSAQSISCNQLSGGTITGQSISGGSISGGAISGGSVTGSSISGGSINISFSGYYFNMGVYTSHPNCSGLNVGSGGINFSTHSVGINSESGTIVAGGTLKASNFTTSTYNDNSFYGVLYAYSGIKTNTINPGGVLNLLAGGTSGSASGSGILIRAGVGHITLDASNGGASYKVYATGAGIGTSAVKTDAGSSSSRNTKTNIVKFDDNKYNDALTLLDSINIYDYDYKYNLYKNKKQYGFIIDDIEQLTNYNKFFDFYTEEARVDGENINFNVDDSEGEEITVKKYNSDTLDKYMLVCIKGLQKKIKELEEKVNE